MPPAELRGIRAPLLAWYRGHRRRLPWRGTRDPYRIWISEVMLQQTRVAAATPYYRRFLRRFPTLRALARARQEDVLRHWAGLGYYRRARHLHRAARVIARRHAGRFPREHAAALALPGVGRYTAAAVLSIAYGAPHAVLDGNVARVLARLGGAGGDVRQPRRWRALAARAQELLDTRNPGAWNQAMMELGATVCTPRAPRCQECPLARWCCARALGRAEQIPSPRRTPRPVRVRVAAAVLLDPARRTLLVPRNPGAAGALFSGMWQFPAVTARGDAARALASRLAALNGAGRKDPLRTQRARRARSSRGDKDGAAGRGAQYVVLPAAGHAVTFRRVTLAPHLVRVARLPRVSGARRVALQAVGGMAVSSATRKIAAAAVRHLGA